MWYVIKNHIGMNAVDIKDNIVVRTFPALTFMMDWSLLRVQEFCKNREWQLEEPNVVTKSKPRNRKYQPTREKKIA